MVTSKITTSFTIVSVAVALAGAVAFLGACEEMPSKASGEGRGAKSAADGTGSGGSDCVNDRDCKGDRICEKGVCTSPR
jgi:hypothetical protein